MIQIYVRGIKYKQKPTHRHFNNYIILKIKGNCCKRPLVSWWVYGRGGGEKLKEMVLFIDYGNDFIKLISLLHLDCRVSEICFWEGVESTLSSKGA